MQESNSKFTMHVLALDLALAHTGIAVYDVAPAHAFQFQLNQYNQFDTEAGPDRDTRLRRLLELIKANIQKCNINIVIAEEPAALFNAKQIKGLMDISTACYGIVGWCHAINLYVRLVMAKQWQSHLGCPSVKGVSKEWSLKNARTILEYIKFHRKLQAKEHHAADAINIGMYAIQQWNSGRWELPTQFSLQG